MEPKRSWHVLGRGNEEDRMSAQRKVVLYIAASLDGYIAREDGSVDWLDPTDTQADDNYQNFLGRIDTIVMGNATYEQTKELAAEFPYREQRCYVFSRKRAGEEEGFVEFINPDIPAFLEELREQEGRHIWLMGGAKILDAFLRERAVDELIITIIPRLLGSGIPLFQNGQPDQRLELLNVEKLGEMVQLHYRLKGNG